MQILEKHLPFGKYQTYCRIVGEKTAKAPLLLLHGGPGSSHNYFEVLDQVAQTSGRQVIMYDQLGCGESSIPDDTPAVYNAQTWVKELENVREQLGLDQIHLLGQSWGGMLAIIYMCDYQPRALNPSSSPLPCLQPSCGARSCTAGSVMPEKQQAAIQQAEASGDFSAPAYQAANAHFMEQHAIKLTPDMPEAVLRKKKAAPLPTSLDGVPTNTRQSAISMTMSTRMTCPMQLPVLITSGTDDLCTPLVAKTCLTICQRQVGAFAGCGHMPFVQENEKYRKI